MPPAQASNPSTRGRGRMSARLPGLHRETLFGKKKTGEKKKDREEKKQRKKRKERVVLA